MSGRISIGEFSSMTRLSRKALRYYHDLGLLEPAEVDPANGYRYYDSTQIEAARLIRRFRELDMPVPDLKAYVAAPDAQARGEIVSAHLDRLQVQLAQTQGAIESLRALLTSDDRLPGIEIRDVADERGLCITDVVRLTDVVDWWQAATRELADGLDAAGVAASGPLRAAFDHALFADEQGEVSIWFPIEQAVPATARGRTSEIAGGRFAVAVHSGPDARLDETYARLGRYVVERGIGVAGPVRESYLAGILDDPVPLITEIGWPVSTSE